MASSSAHTIESGSSSSGMNWRIMIRQTATGRLKSSRFAASLRITSGSMNSPYVRVHNPACNGQKVLEHVRDGIQRL
jgi:hypothetical protein